MRLENGVMVTLEEDIQRIWSAHGMNVICETVANLSNIDANMKGFVWTIRAEPR